jgi:hypothetical protein
MQSAMGEIRNPFSNVIINKPDGVSPLEMSHEWFASHEIPLCNRSGLIFSALSTNSNGYFLTNSPNTSKKMIRKAFQFPSVSEMSDSLKYGQISKVHKSCARHKQGSCMSGDFRVRTTADLVADPGHTRFDVGIQVAQESPVENSVFTCICNVLVPLHDD